MVDSRISPDGDGLFDLFGDIVSGRADAARTATSTVFGNGERHGAQQPPLQPIQSHLGTPQPIAPPAAPAQNFTSRRDRRAAEAAIAVPPEAYPPAVPQYSGASQELPAPIWPTTQPATRNRSSDFRSTSSQKQRKPSRRELKELQASGRSRPPVPAYADQYPGARKVVVVRPAPPRKKHKVSGLLTMLAVGGLFASFALPAYAFAPTADADTTPKSTQATGETLKVSDKVAAADATRTDFSATTAQALRRQTATAMMAANYAAYMASGAREKGDDYPWFSELSNEQGGGLSPLNYFYRECVDFVAWRLNRDAGSYSAPFVWTWKTLTPTGGNASQWKYAWLKHGWPTGSTPVVGAVAWYPYNHVAYVKSVNGDGTVTLEEYNQSGLHLYGQRVAPASSVSLYLYAPPHP